jgi:copper chaperone CopZ
MHRKCKSHVTLLVSLVAIGATTPVLAVPTQARVEQVQIVADEMCCKGCARTVSRQVYAARGVKEVGVDMESRMVTVALPQPNPAMLGLLWHAVEKGEGGPTKLITVDATYTLIRPKVEATEVQKKQQANAPLSIVIDNLHCQGCAKKIAAQLYAVKGVTKVSVDMQHETLFVEARPEAQLSPWNLIHAVTQANERPLAVNGPYGTLAIGWSTERAPKNHQPSQQTNIGGFQE